MAGLSGDAASTAAAGGAAAGEREGDGNGISPGNDNEAFFRGDLEGRSAGSGAGRYRSGSQPAAAGKRCDSVGKRMKSVGKRGDSVERRRGSEGRRVDSTATEDMLDSARRRADSVLNRANSDGKLLDSVGKRASLAAAGERLDSSRKRADSVGNRVDSVGDRAENCAGERRGSAAAVSESATQEPPRGSLGRLRRSRSTAPGEPASASKYRLEKVHSEKDISEKSYPEIHPSEPRSEPVPRRPSGRGARALQRSKDRAQDAETNDSGVCEVTRPEGSNVVACSEERGTGHRGLESLGRGESFAAADVEESAESVSRYASFVLKY